MTNTPDKNCVCETPKRTCADELPQSVSEQDINDFDTDYFDPDDECTYCRGDGRDPDIDYLLPCPYCG